MSVLYGIAAMKISPIGCEAFMQPNTCWIGSGSTSSSWLSICTILEVGGELVFLSGSISYKVAQSVAVSRRRKDAIERKQIDNYRGPENSILVEVKSTIVGQEDGIFH